MQSNTNNTLSSHQSTLAVSHRDAVTSTESHPTLDGEPTSTIKSTYASFYWLINYIQMCISRLANDIYTSFLIYWYPGRELLPPHILHLMHVQNRLRAERESHTVTYSRERVEAHSSTLSLRKIVNAFKYYILSSEDEASIPYTPKDISYLGNNREPMFVIVDSSCVSNPSSMELLIDNRFHAKDSVPNRLFNKNVKPVDLPSTSRDLRNDFLPPLLTESDSTDEMQMIDINLHSDNDILFGADTECDNDSIVMSYIKNRKAFLDLEELSDESLDVLIPSYAGSRSSSYDNVIEATALVKILPSSFTKEVECGTHKQAIDFLHHDIELLVAAEMGDEKMLRSLINLGTNINVKDHLGRNALHLAVGSDNRNIVAMLLMAGVEPNVKDNLGMTPLSLCLMRSPCWRMVALLFDYGALIIPRISPMDTGLFLQFVMMCIPTEEEERILHLLIERGASVNDPEAPGGRQALHFAAMSNNTRLVSVLVDLGADLLAVNHRNQTPKQVAATFDCKEALSHLEQLEHLCNILNVTTNELDESGSEVEEIRDDRDNT